MPYEKTTSKYGSMALHQPLTNMNIKDIADLQTGKAGEYLVCADLIKQGYVAFPSEQSLSYDVVADIGGRLLRVQVKTTKTYRASPQREIHTPAYFFETRRCGKGGHKKYIGHEFDILAAVALDSGIIAYLPIEMEDFPFNNIILALKSID